MNDIMEIFNKKLEYSIRMWWENARYIFSLRVSFHCVKVLFICYPFLNRKTSFYSCEEKWMVEKDLKSLSAAFIFHTKTLAILAWSYRGGSTAFSFCLLNVIEIDSNKARQTAWSSVSNGIPEPSNVASYVHNECHIKEKNRNALNLSTPSSRLLFQIISFN